MAEAAAGGGEISLEALNRRLTRLEDERAILETLHRYGQAIDGGLDREWAELFTEDGEFLCVDRAGGVILREQGREALVAWASNHKAGETRLMKHLVIAPVVTIDGDNARVVSYYANMVENENPLDPPHVRYMGRYVDDMVKDSGGRWRFFRRVSETEAPLLG